MNFYQLFGAILVFLVVSSEERAMIGNNRYERPTLALLRMFKNFQVNCQVKSYGLKTIQDVQDAIEMANEGETIRLDPIVYEGDLEINTKKFIIVKGENHCTVIRGQVSIQANNLIIDGIVFENTENAIEVRKSENIKLLNLVMKEINGNAITVRESTDVQVDNLWAENITGNVLDSG